MKLGEDQELRLRIGSLIRTEREKRDLMQDQLALSLHVTKQQISKYESCKDDISAINLYKLAKRLQMDLRTFFVTANEFEQSADSVVEIDHTLLSSPDVPELLINWDKIGESQRRALSELLRVLAVATELQPAAAASSAV